MPYNRWCFWSVELIFIDDFILVSNLKYSPPLSYLMVVGIEGCLQAS